MKPSRPPDDPFIGAQAVEVTEPLGDRVSRRFNLVRAIGWAAMIPLAYFAGWIYSVAFVAICSLYANAASDWAAYRADQNRDLLERLTRLEAAQGRILEILEERTADARTPSGEGAQHPEA